MTLSIRHYLNERHFCEPRDRGFVPNHQVSITPGSLAGGSDSVMEFAFGLIRSTNEGR
jgi:hypothetical protein